MKKELNKKFFSNFRVGLGRCLTLFNFLLTTILLTTSLAVGQQNAKKIISLKLDRVSVLQALQEINKLSGNSVIFKKEEVMRETKKVTVDLKSVTVLKAVEECIEGTNLICSERNGNVAVGPKDEVTWLTITGVVTDAKGLPLPGATVMLKGGERVGLAASTDIQGKYTLKVPSGTKVLQVSFVGYKSKTITIDGHTRIDVVLEEDVQSLDEAIVVAYGTTTKRESTGSISVVKGEEMRGIPSSSIANLLQGRVAGMDVTNMSGAPGGGGTTITIRGYNSLDVDQGRRFSDPLWVVDGVPLNSFTSPITGTNLLSDLNPDMIESIQVLKDASSAAIYGSRAANGVIIVTTKKGRQNQDATFSVNASRSWGILPKLPTITMGRDERNFRLKAMMNAPQAYLDPKTWMYTYPKSLREIYDNKGGKMNEFFVVDGNGEGEGSVLQDSLNPFYNNATNFFPMYYETAKITNVNLQTYGGTDRVTYGVGLGYYSESGILKGTGFTRVDLNSSMNIIPVKKLMIDIKFNASLINRKRGTETSESEGFNYSPSVETVPGDPYKLSTLLPGVGSSVWNNILEKQKGTDEKNRTVRLRSNFKMAYEIFKGAYFSVSGAVDYVVSRRNYFQPSYFNEHGFSLSLGETAVNLMALNENLLTYKTSIHEKHNFDIVAGFSYQYDQAEYNGGNAQNSPSDKIYYAPNGMPTLGKINYGDYTETIAFQKYISDMQEKKLISYFGRFEYNYDKKYLLSLAFRRDGSSVFGKNNKWGSFPSISGAWIFSEESFVKNCLGWLNYGKVRASWGRSGMHFSQNYLALGIMMAGDSFEGNSTLTPNRLDGLYNENLSWEETDQYDFGFDLDLFNYRLGITMDYYYRYTDKLLDRVRQPQDMHTGYLFQWCNAGAISNEGIELLVKYEIFRKSDLYWKISVNAAKNWNRYEKSYDGLDQSSVGIIGKPLNGIYAYKTDGFIHSQEELPIFYNNIGIGHYLGNKSYYYEPGDYKFMDVNGDGEINNKDQIYAGSALPELYGGIVSEIRWKNFDLNILMSYQLGRHIINFLPTNSICTRGGSIEKLFPVLLDLKNVTFWDEAGEDADYSDLEYVTGKENYSFFIDRNVEKVNWIKLKTLTLGYSLPKEWIKVCGMEQVRFFVSGENLFTITNYSGIDPETVDITTGYDKGVNYPLARKYTVGLTVKF